MVPTHNVDAEQNTPYVHSDGQCASVTPNTDYFAIDWHLVDPSNDIDAIPTVQQIKEALCKHGAISASVFVSDLFQAYTVQKVHKETIKYNGTNHAVCIIGWDDSLNAWIIKNSWGNAWGNNCDYGSAHDLGYMYIDYGSNNIGRRAAWVTAK